MTGNESMPPRRPPRASGVATAGFRTIFNSADRRMDRIHGRSQDVVRFNWRSMPGGAITEHVHPHQQERFIITAGEAHFTVSGEEHVVGPGDTLDVPAGVRHSESNQGSVEVVGVVELRPALGTKEMFEAFAGLAAEGKTTPRGAPKNPLQLGATFWHFRHESRATAPPIWMQNLVLPAPVGAREDLRRTPLLRSLGQPDHVIGAGPMKIAVGLGARPGSVLAFDASGQRIERRRGAGNHVFASQQDDAADEYEDQEQHEPDDVENQPERGDDAAQAEALKEEQDPSEDRSPPKPTRQHAAPYHEQPCGNSSRDSRKHPPRFRAQTSSGTGCRRRRDRVER